MHQAPLFRSLDVRLALSDVLRSTPTTPSVKVRYNVKVSYVLQLAWSRPGWFWILGQPRPLNTTCAYNVTAYLCICQLKFKTTAPVDYRCMLHTDVYSIIVFFVFEKHQSGDRKIGSRHCVIAD